MSDKQLIALLASLKENFELQQRLKNAVDLNQAVSIAKESGFDVDKEDWLRYSNQASLELSDAQLEGIAGGQEKETARETCQDLSTCPPDCPQEWPSDII
jgi:predicted ribosomally synthesized peptide with nif11-like leader